MKPIRYGLCAGLVFLLALTACEFGHVQNHINQLWEDSKQPWVEATATKTIQYQDTLFSAQAYVDANDNGELDNMDWPLEGAVLIVRVDLGVEFEHDTDDTGYAVVIIPENNPYPVTLSMKPPDGGRYTLIGPKEVTLKLGSDKKHFFLFKEVH